MMRVSSCCCGCRLSTGCLILAILGIFGGIFQIILGAVAPYYPYLATGIVYLIVNILLIVGVQMKNRVMVLFWIVLTGMNTIAAGIIVILFTIFFVTVSVVLAILYACFTGAFICLNVYFIIVVSSFYQDIQEEQREYIASSIPGFVKA